jgi:outer membrane protein assembly factor BamB
MTMSRRESLYTAFRSLLAATFLLGAVGGPQADLSANQSEPALAARKILEATGIQGGVIVHLGCGDGRLTAALHGGDGFLVHGLDADPDNVAAARRHVQSLGRYGSVTIDRLDGPHLPYVDNLVNLVVARDLGEVPLGEVMRVLCPRGVAYIMRDGQWTETVKPRPATIDDWTHYLHDASNNAVAHDTVVGPPRHMQWVGGPRYSRHHDRMSSVSAAVSAGGRVFYVFDEASPISILLPPKWTLIARDAFNGTILWKRSIDRWHTHLWPLKSGPAQLPRRLVAEGDRVYVTLGINAPLVALDAATGATVRTYADTAGTEEVILHDGKLFALVNEQTPESGETDMKRISRAYGGRYWDEVPRQVMAIRAVTGEQLWSEQHRVLPSTLATDGNRVVFHNGKQVVCLDAAGGRELWQSEPVARSEEIRGFYLPTLVLYKDVVLFSGGETAGAQTGSWYTDGQDTLSALAADTGEVLWTAYHPPSGYRSPEDLLVVNGLVWTGETTSGRAVGVFTGRDPRTGEVRAEFPPDVETYWFHHRCYRGKATDNYLLMARSGTEFVDVREQHWDANHWVRGACMYGVMPANGLLYAPQHPCACYLEAKMAGFTALAPAGRSWSRQLANTDQISGGSRLRKGPAYDAVKPPPRQRPGAQPAASSDWPTYRHDAARSGTASTSVPADLAPAWKKKIGGRLSSPVIAGGRVFVAEVDAHAVHALDAVSGERLWQFDAGGRVDSPPTVFEGRVLFGSSDGYVYALRAADGELAWRFRAAPLDRRLTAFGQIESVWPLHGSVLVQDGVLFCVAGRSMFVDGGLRLWRLDPRTGQVLSETVLDGHDPSPEQDVESYVSWLNMPVALPDILSSDGKYVYMRSQPFRLDGSRLPMEAMPMGPDVDRGAPPATQRTDIAHLFSPTGYLDDAWWHRSYWMYGSRFVSGWCGYFRAGKAAPAGKILVFDEDKLYGFGRKPKYYRWTTPIEHHLFAADKLPPPESLSPENKPGESDFLVQHHWTKDLPLLPRALVLADGTLFMAGPEDLIDEEQALKQIDVPAVQEQLSEQAAAFAGQRGGLLWAVSAADSRTLGELRLESPPVFDGMAAADGRLYLSTQAGTVVCLTEQQ